MTIYVSKHGQRYGPYSVEELRAEVLKGFFQPENFATSNHGETWVPISAFPGIGSFSYRVEAKAADNLLLLSYYGKVTATDAEQCGREIEQSLTSLRPGFRLLSDFSKLESMEIACAPHIEHVMDLCNARGIQGVIRVIPHPQKDIGLGIMSHFHYRPSVHIVTCETLAEAEQILRQSQPTDMSAS
jgi:GYF domain 2